MKRLFDVILAHPKLVLAAAIAVAAVGWRVGKSLPVDVFPEIREARVVVQVEAGGLTAEEVEQRVTIPIEAVMNGIPGVRKVRSSSGGGLSFVWIEFDWDVDLLEARYSVFERLASVREQLPEEIHAEIAPIVSITGEIMLVALTCPDGRVSSLALRETAEFDLRTAEEAKDVGWWEDPELNVDFLRILKADEYPNLFGGSLAFTVPLSGVPGLEARAAELYAEDEAQAVRAAERRLRVDVRTAAIRWAAAMRREDTLRSTQEDAAVTNAFACATRLFGAGEVDEADLSTARRRRHERSHALRNAELATSEAKTAFCRLLGVSPTANVALPADVWAEGAPPVVALPEELTRHESVRAALARLEGTEAAFHAEIRRQYPNLTVGPAYEREDGLNRVGFVAGLTLPLWNRNRKAIARSETERDLARFGALEAWKGLVWDSVAAARRYRQLSAHAKPEGLDRGTVDRLHETGELSDIAYLAVCDEIAEAMLEEISWREQLLVARNELTYYTIEK